MVGDTDLANLAFGKLGGAGDQTTGKGFIDDIDSDDRNSNWAKTLLPQCRRTSITDLAELDCPARESVRYADLGAKIDVLSLPEIGSWKYAFNIPLDCLALTGLIKESELSCDRSDRKKYPCDIIANKDESGKILLTNDLTNTNGTSAFIEYVIDVVNPAAFNQKLKSCIVTLLASELVPLCGKDSKMRAALLTEYETLCIPQAQAFNQSQIQNYEPEVENYLGGRC